MAKNGGNKDNVTRELQREADRIADWIAEAKLTLNTFKCEMAFHSLHSAESKFQPNIVKSGVIRPSWASPTTDSYPLPIHTRDERTSYSLHQTSLWAGTKQIVVKCAPQCREAMGTMHSSSLVSMAVRQAEVGITHPSTDGSNCYHVERSRRKKLSSSAYSVLLSWWSAIITNVETRWKSSSTSHKPV